MWLYLPTKDGVVDELILPNLKSKIHKMQYLIQSEQKIYFPTSLLMANQTALKMLISNTNYDDLLQDFEYLKAFQPFVLKQ